MKSISLLGVLGAVLTGMLIGGQAALGNRSGAIIGPVRTSLLMNVFGGAIALLSIAALWVTQRKSPFEVPSTLLTLLFFAGLMGVFIVIGVSASLQVSGVTAGIAALILGQMLIGTVVDAVGWGAAEPIPVSASRIAGLLVMAVAVFLLVPRT